MLGKRGDVERERSVARERGGGLPIPAVTRTFCTSRGPQLVVFMSHPRGIGAVPKSVN